MPSKIENLSVLRVSPIRCSAAFTPFHLPLLQPAANLLRILTSLFVMAATQLTGQASAAERPATFCNPLDLEYRFCLDKPSRREAADPAVFKFKNEFWLFASKSGGYWHSPDLIRWKLIEPTGLPLEDYAPAVESIGDRLFYTAFNTRAIFSTTDPLRGTWKREAGSLLAAPDPALFRDDDGRVYMYDGCSDGGDLKAVELDPSQSFKVVRGPVSCMPSDYARHGFEVAGEENRGMTNQNGRVQMSPWTEGAWVTKRKGIYYLEYATPGTQFRTYADGIYTSTNPMGPFTFAPYSPFSHKPTGFIGGAGHSSTVEDNQGHYWHISTMVISVRHMFERRLGLFPVGFADDGQIFCNTYLGDYPQFVPGSQKRPEDNNSPGWMLLSYAKPATASSVLEGFPVTNAFDEDIRTWWSAKSGGSNEWLRVDLGKPCQLEALQINFADQGATNLDRLRNDGYGYYVESSTNGENWAVCVDRRSNFRDAPHDYIQLDRPVVSRYLRLVSVHMPAGGLFLRERIPGIWIRIGQSARSGSADHGHTRWLGPAPDDGLLAAGSNRGLLHRPIWHPPRPAFQQLPGLRERSARDQQPQYRRPV